MVDAPAVEQSFGGEPLAPPTISLPMFGRDYPLMHGAATMVAAAAEYGCVVLALGHPGFEAGFFMGLTPAGARDVARWLAGCADEIDAGSVVN